MLNEMLAKYEVLLYEHNQFIKNNKVNVCTDGKTTSLLHITSQTYTFCNTLQTYCEYNFKPGARLVSYN